MNAAFSPQSESGGKGMTSARIARALGSPKGAPAFPPGAWPARMDAALSAAYCGEPSIEAFIKRVGKEYPLPDVAEGRRRLWLKEKLDKAIGNSDASQAERDVALDL